MTEIKILLCQKTDNKTADNFRAQWKYAPLYMDRREALAYFAKNKMTYELSLGLKDKYPGLRIYTMNNLMNDSAALTNTLILQTVKTIAQTDTSTLAKGKALEFLAATKSADYKGLFEKDVNDSSYAISAAALAGIGNFDSSKALSLARSFQKTAKGDLLEASSATIIQFGDESDFDAISSSYNSMPNNQAKFNITPTFCSYLARLNDTAKIKTGIDMVIDFRNAIPQAYRGNVDPAFVQYLGAVGEGKR